MEMNKTYFVTSTKRFIKAIKETETLFGGSLLLAISCALIIVVLQTYATLAIFFDGNIFQDWRMGVLGAGAIGLGILNIANIAFPPEMIQELLKRIDRISSKLAEVAKDDTTIAMDDGHTIEYSTAIENIKNQLNKIEGLNVLEFFILKRSLLTSILAHYITYCIVLLQFKVSEK